jgi:hypothetical protein
MSPPSWKFILATRTGSNVGEIKDADARQVVRSYFGPSTGGFTIRADNAQFPRLVAAAEGDYRLKAYRDGKLILHGDVLTAEMAADDPNAVPTLAVTAADPAWRFARRVSGKSAAGTLFTNVDRVTIAETLIATANAETNGETGIQTLGVPSGNPAVTWIAGPYRALGECIAELAQTTTGFDWRIDPIEYTSGKIGQFKAAAVGTLGTARGGVVFEYQGRGNARVPTIQRSIADVVNQVWSIPDEGPTSNLGVRSAADATSQAARGLLEEVVDTAGITNNTLRDQVLGDHIAFRKQPKLVVTFSPEFADGTGRVPAYGIEYVIGDQVRVRVLYEGVTLIDGMVRLYKMQFDIDANDKETLTPTVVQEA